MLRQRIRYYTERDLDLDNLQKEICAAINLSLETHDPSLLHKWFGSITFKDCLDADELEEHRQKFKRNSKGEFLSIDSLAEAIEEDYRSIYFVLGFYMACLRGSIPVASYYINLGKFPGDVTRGYSANLVRKHFGLQEKLEGPPLALAIRSGNLDLVKFIYENTNAMVETSLEPPREPTTLMVAIKLGHQDIVKYLLTHSANPNAHIPFGDSPLLLAIQAKNINIIRSLVNAGAIVTTDEVHKAIRQNVSLEIIHFLLLNCINREDLYEPFLFSAIESGNVNLLLTLEKHPLVKSFDEIRQFNDKSIDETMVHSAAESGSVEMMKHLAEARKIAIEKIFANDLTELEKQAASESKDQTSIERIENITSRHLFAAATSRSNDVSLLAYLCETLALKPSEKIIKTLCSMSINRLKSYAYLFRFLEKPPASEATLNAIAFQLENLSLDQLFQLYNCPLIVNGNHFESYDRGYREQIAAMIKEKESKLDASVILQLVKSDKEAATGALFYYCTNEFDKNSERFIFLLTQLTIFSSMFKNVDIQNCRGDSLSKFAQWQRSFNIVKLLLARGANPDLPDQKGETLLYGVMRYSSALKDGELEVVQNYVNKVTNTLRFACKESLGGYEELEWLLTHTKGEIQDASISEMIADCLPTHNAWRKLRVLFIHLSEANAKAMVALFKDDRFIEEHKISKDTITDTLSMFERVDIKELSADDKARRLGVVTKQAKDHIGFFNSAEKIAAAEMKSDKGVTSSPTLGRTNPVT